MLLVAGGFRVIYDRETPFELRIQVRSETNDADERERGSLPQQEEELTRCARIQSARTQDADNTPQQVGTLEAIKVKILILGDDADVHAVKVELSTESDLFFLYSHTCDLEAFQAMQEQQKLMIDFADYANVLIRMLNNCIKEPHNHLAVYLMQADGRARLDFIQNMEYKFVELLSVDFMRVSDETIRQHICFRYNSMKSRLQVLQTRLHVREGLGGFWWFLWPHSIWSG